MSFNRLCRLLKPTLLCGALAVPGLASTMVSAAPLAVGRARGLPYGARGRGDLGRGAPASGARTALGAPSAAVGAVGSARAGVTVRVSVGGGGRVRGSLGQGWAVGTPGWAPQTHRSCSVGDSWGRRRWPLEPRLRPGERGCPTGWKSGITRHGASLPLPRPARPGAPRGGVTEERPSALGYRPFVLWARRSVGTGAAGDWRAWDAQPPAPRVVAGSDAGCWPGGGAETPGGGGLESAVAGGRAPGFRRLPRALGRWGPAAGERGSGSEFQDLVRAGPPHPRAASPPAGVPGGVPNTSWVSVSVVKCALL